MAKKGLSPLSVTAASDFVFTVALGTIIGGRLGYCIFYSPDLFTSFEGSFPYWGVFALNKGGMASHGGIAGIVITCLLFARKYRVSGWHLSDLSTLGGSIGIFFGRIANFINGELVGRACSENLAWGVKFPQDILLWPTKAPEKLAGLSDVVAHLGMDTERWKSIVDGFLINKANWATIDTVLNDIIEKIQGGNSLIANALEPLLILRHPSQLYAGFLEGAFLFTCLVLIWRFPRKPGVITGWFFAIYSAVRIFGEQFRLPDAHIGYQLFGLTRGQWLSIAMLAVGIAILWYTSTRKTHKLGGWKSPQTLGAESGGDN